MWQENPNFLPSMFCNEAVAHVIQACFAALSNAECGCGLIQSALDGSNDVYLLF